MNTQLFPKTTEIMKKSKAPSLEVFFARQPAGTGIKPHTDNSNFIMTGHLAIVVPQGSSVENLWIKVSLHDFRFVPIA
jgi:aspartate beta-hydroxylase